MKKCSKCKLIKKDEEFNRDVTRHGGLSARCKLCHNNMQNSKNRNNIKCDRELYDYIFEKQSGKCAICGKHQSELSRELCADHDHITGQIRGLLCSKCNLLLGYVNDNITILENAKNYLINAYFAS